MADTVWIVWGHEMYEPAWIVNICGSESTALRVKEACELDEDDPLISYSVENRAVTW